LVPPGVGRLGGIVGDRDVTHVAKADRMMIAFYDQGSPHRRAEQYRGETGNPAEEAAFRARSAEPSVRSQ